MDYLGRPGGGQNKVAILIKGDPYRNLNISITQQMFVITECCIHKCPYHSFLPEQPLQAYL